MPDLPTIKAQLLKAWFSATEIPAVAGVCVCAFFLKTAGALHDLSIEPSGLIYLGMTESSLEVPNHFEHRAQRTLDAPPHTRRAIEDIAAVAAGSSQRWAIAEQCTALTAFFVIGEDIRAVERSLIVELRPPLNLVG
jgi:hypothetical protein